MEGQDYGGWMIKDFLGIDGLISESLWQIPSGINVVPFTIDEDPNFDLAAGVTGYNITEDGVTDPKSKRSYPVVQSVQGWGLFHKLIAQTETEDQQEKGADYGKKLKEKNKKKNFPCFQQ